MLEPNKTCCVCATAEFLSPKKTQNTSVETNSLPLLNSKV